MKLILFLTILVVSIQALSQQKENPRTLDIGSEAIDFNLPGTDGKMYSLASFNDAQILVLVFSAPHCPTAQAYEDRLIDLQNQFGSKGVQLVMINPNSPEALCLEERGYTDLGDTFEDMKIRAIDKGYNFPFLDDGSTEETTLKYGPVATPHAFVFDKNRILRYAGRVDNSEKIGTATEHDLKNAVVSLLNGEEVEVKTTKVFGCSIKMKMEKRMANKTR